MYKYAKNINSSHMKWIILDAMGVVYKTGDDTNDLLIPYIKRRNSNVDSNFIHDLYIRTSTGHFTAREFWNQLGFMEEYPGIEQEYLNNYLQLDDDIIRFFQLLDYKSYQVAMLSNDVSEWSLWLRNKFGIGSWISHFIISGDVKVRKPDAGIFHIALSRLQAQPSDCVFIDDRLKNLQTAARLGLRTIFFDRDQIGRDAIVDPKSVDAYASNFSDLMPVIKHIF
jgi:HAD superfamily hydrolase (TIGR01509 family)